MKKTILKILIPVLIVAIIVGMWIYKNASEKEEISQANNTNVSENITDAKFPLKITSVNLEGIKQYGVPVILDFGSDSCIPCKEMAPVLKKLNEEMQEKAAIQFMDVWKYTDGVQDFPVQVIPTQVLFNADGTPFMPSEELAQKIQFDMYSHRETNEHIFTVHQGGLNEEQMRAILKEMGVE